MQLWSCNRGFLLFNVDFIDDAGEGGDGYAVVCERHGAVLRKFSAVLNLFFVEHTAAAVNDHLIGRQIIRESFAGSELQLQLCPGALFEPGWNLDSAYVAALSVMGTAFRDQNPVSILQSADRCRARYRGLQEAFISGHQNRERGQGDLRGNHPAYFAEYLRVGDHEFRRLAQVCQRLCQFRIPADQGRSTRFQNVPDRLLLGEDQTALGGGFVDGDHQYRCITGFQQIGNGSQNSSFVYALIIIQGFSYRRVASLMTGKKALRPVFFVLQRQLV